MRHESLNRSPRKNWVELAGELPAMVQHIAKDIHEERGIPLSMAIPIAIAQVKKLAAKGNKEAAKAVAEWEALKAKSKARKAGKAMAASGGDWELVQAAADALDVVDVASPRPAASGDLPGVELARPGVWHLKTGTTEFTADMLRDAADFYAATGGQAIPLGLGHADTRFDGDPAWGSLTNVRYAEDDRGPVLVGDLVGMPDWLHAAAPTRWPNRSIEGVAGVQYGGRTYRLALTRLALLGATPPGVRNIRSLADLQQALVAAGDSPIVASPQPYDAEPLAAASGDDPETPPVEPAAGPTPTNQGGLMPDLDEGLRQRLGLAEDADEAAILAAVDELKGKATAAPAEPPATPDKDTPATTDGAPVDGKPADVAADLVPVAASAPVVPDEWRQVLEQTTRELAEIKASHASDKREALFRTAVRDGKITPADRAEWEKRYDRGPEAAVLVADIIASIAPGSAVPIAASGQPGGEPVESEEDFSHLWPPAPAGKEG